MTTNTSSQLNPLTFKLHRERTALLVIDIQERLCAAMERPRVARLVNRTVALIEGAKALGLPVVLTEQYPKGLGPTLAEVREHLPAENAAIEKMEFSAWVPQLRERIGDRDQLLLCGMETHVCVFQTARDIALAGRIPFLCADAALSRTEEERQIGMARCRDVGGVVTSAESALFDLLERAGGPAFKTISSAVK